MITWSPLITDSASAVPTTTCLALTVGDGESAGQRNGSKIARILGAEVWQEAFDQDDALGTHPIALYDAVAVADWPGIRRILLDSRDFAKILLFCFCS